MTVRTRPHSPVAWSRWRPAGSSNRLWVSVRRRKTREACAMDHRVWAAVPVSRVGPGVDALPDSVRSGVQGGADTHVRQRLWLAQDRRRARHSAGAAWNGFRGDSVTRPPDSDLLVRIHD